MNQQQFGFKSHRIIRHFSPSNTGDRKRTTLHSSNTWASYPHPVAFQKLDLGNLIWPEMSLSNRFKTLYKAFERATQLFSFCLRFSPFTHISLILIAHGTS